MRPDSTSPTSGDNLSNNSYIDTRISNSTSPTSEQLENQNNPSPTENRALSTFLNAAAAFTGFSKGFKEDLPTNALVISVIGYIIIASFGKMDLFQYVGYIVFLFFALMLYRYAQRPWKIKKPNLYLLVISLVSSTLLIIDKHVLIGHFFRAIYRFLTK